MFDLSQYDGYSKDKTDEELAELVRTAGDDRDLAIRVLWDRYYPVLAKRFIRQFGDVEGEDMAHLVLERFILYVSYNKIEFKVDNLVNTIAKRSGIDVLRKKTATERKLFHTDRILDFGEIPDRKRPSTRWGGGEVKNLYPLLLRLSVCQRMAWILNSLLGYHGEAVGRLMGRSSNTIYVSCYQARKHIKSAINRRSGKEDSDNQIFVNAESLGYLGRHLFLERNDHDINPDLRIDELKPLGLSPREFKRHRASIFLPWYEDELQQTEIGDVYLILGKPFEPSMQEIVERFDRVDTVQDHNIPDEYLIKVKFDGDNIALEPQGLIRFLVRPIVKTPLHNWKKYLTTPISVHSARRSFLNSLIPAEIHVNYTGYSPYIHLNFEQYLLDTRTRSEEREEDGFSYFFGRSSRRSRK